MNKTQRNKLISIRKWCTLLDKMSVKWFACAVNFFPLSPTTLISLMQTLWVFAVFSTVSTITPNNNKGKECFSSLPLQWKLLSLSFFVKLLVKCKDVAQYFISLNRDIIFFFRLSCLVLDGEGEGFVRAVVVLSSSPPIFAVSVSKSLLYFSRTTRVSAASRFQDLG